MKHNLLKSILALAIFGSWTLSAVAEEQAPAPLLTEGRSWLYASVATFDGDTLGYYRIDVVGDTVANNRSCKKLARYNVNSPESKTYHAVCEDNGYLYFFYKNPMSLNPEQPDSVPLVDFRAKGGDVVYSYDFAHGGFESDPLQLRVATPDYIEVNGELRRRLTLFDYADMPAAYWVEGVGASRLLSTLRCPGHSTSVDVFVACYENGKRIFETKDFTKKPAATSPILDYRTGSTVEVADDDLEDYRPEFGYTWDDKGFTLDINIRYAIVADCPYEAGTLLWWLPGNRRMVGEHNEVLPVIEYKYDLPAEYKGVKVTLLESDYTDFPNCRLAPKMPIHFTDGDNVTFTVEPFEGFSPENLFAGEGQSGTNALNFVAARYSYDESIVRAFTHLKFRVDYSNEAGIEEVSTQPAAADGAIYDLQGRRLAKPIPGQLYIRDGRLRRN